MRPSVYRGIDTEIDPAQALLFDLMAYNRLQDHKEEMREEMQSPSTKNQIRESRERKEIIQDERVVERLKRQQERKSKRGR